jgi:hypothetical protein
MSLFMAVQMRALVSLTRSGVVAHCSADGNAPPRPPPTLQRQDTELVLRACLDRKRV